MPLIRFPSFTVQAPDGWQDITDSVEADDAPFTLARADGVGALQFSVALHTGGERPGPSPQQLLEMVEEFGQSRGLGVAGAVATQAGPPQLAAGSFESDGDRVRVWYVSDGLSFALVTFVCEAGREADELAECELIVRSVRFAVPH
jgi:hypothetical protein